MTTRRKRRTTAVRTPRHAGVGTGTFSDQCRHRKDESGEGKR